MRARALRSVVTYINRAGGAASSPSGYATDGWIPISNGRPVGTLRVDPRRRSVFAPGGPAGGRPVGRESTLGRPAFRMIGRGSSASSGFPF